MAIKENIEKALSVIKTLEEIKPGAFGPRVFGWNESNDGKNGDKSAGWLTGFGTDNEKMIYYVLWFGDSDYADEYTNIEPYDEKHDDGEGQWVP